VRLAQNVIRAPFSGIIATGGRADGCRRKYDLRSMDDSAYRVEVELLQHQLSLFIRQTVLVALTLD